MITKSAIQEFYPNGKLEWNIPLAVDPATGKNLPHGAATKYYKDGKIMKTKNFVHGKIVGEEVLFHRNGNVAQRLTFDERGMKHGKFCTYFPDGKLESETVYEDGQKVGKSKRFDEKGNDVRGK